MAELTINLSELGQFLVDEIGKELAEQGHVLTGKLKQSIEYTTKRLLNGDLELDVRMLAYWVYVERGVRASRIPFSNKRRRGGAGGKKSKYIQGLVDFVKKRGMASLDSKALSIAFAIAKTHKKEGMPTRGSYSYSQNGRRKFFQRFSTNKNEARIIDLSAEAYGEGLEDLVTRKIAKLVA